MSENHVKRTPTYYSTDCKPEKQRPPHSTIRMLLLDRFSIRRIHDRADEMRILRKLSFDMTPSIFRDLTLLKLPFRQYDDFHGDIVYVKPNHRRVERCEGENLIAVYIKKDWGGYHPSVNDLVAEFRLSLGDALPWDYPYEDHIVILQPDDPNIATTQPYHKSSSQPER